MNREKNTSSTEEEKDVSHFKIRWEYKIVFKDTRLYIFSEYHDDKNYSFVYKNPYYTLQNNKAVKEETNHLETMKIPEDLIKF